MNVARLVGTVVLAVAILAHTPLEARMVTHMLVQIPMLLLAGALFTLPRTPREHHWSPGLVAGAFVFVTGVVTTWMIPRALDAAVEQWVVNAIKACTLVAAGALTVPAWRAASPLARTFVVGNSAWMTATFGLLYLDAPARLCTSYGRGEQQQVGIALVATTILAVALAWRAITRPGVATE